MKLKSGWIKVGGLSLVGLVGLVWAVLVWQPLGGPAATSLIAWQAFPLRTRADLERYLAACGFSAQTEGTWIQADSTVAVAEGLAARLGMEPLSLVQRPTDGMLRLNSFGPGICVTAELAGASAPEASGTVVAPVVVRVQLGWGRLPTPATLIATAHNRHHRENRQRLLAAGFTTQDGYSYEHPRLVYAAAAQLANALGAEELMPVPNGPPIGIVESANGDELYVVVESTEDSRWVEYDARDTASVSMYVNLNAGTSGLPPEAPEAPPPTVASVRAVLVECGFKAEAGDQYRAVNVGDFQVALVLRSMGSPPRQVLSAPRNGEAGQVVSRAANAHLGVTAQMTFEVRSARSKPGGDFCREMIVKLPAARPAQ